ncbi:MAG TPA: Lpg1974 family pore-forming outer membrane protein [Gemmataceae bacterium]|nr:Lpg1974 family pore-forming outer membrane protein [Gemmataceae bacterium]
MVANGRFLLAALALAALSAPAAPAQPPPPAPVPVLPPSNPGPPQPTLGPPAAAPIAGPTTPPPPPPLFDQPNPGANAAAAGSSADTGLLFGVELDFTKPNLNNRLNGTATFPDGSKATVAPPGTDLAWTVAPSFTLGYRLGDDFGALAFTYRFLISEGNADGLSPLGDVNFHSRLDLDEFDFDYIMARYSPGPFWNLQGRVGIRLADVYFDSGAELAGVACEQASSNFIGAGPHFGLEAERRFPMVDGLAAFGRLDGAVLVGQIQQHFRQGFLFPDGTTFAGAGVQRGTQTVPVLSLQAGLAYTPPRMDYIHFTFGYQFEDWWNVGRLNASDGEFNDQGLFVRGELDF